MVFSIDSRWALTMNDLRFGVTGVRPMADGMTPVLSFTVRISQSEVEEVVQSILLNAQIQIQPTHRAYDSQEKEKLVELFGTPERWGQTVRNRLWAHAHTTVSPFQGETEAELHVPCTCDLNIASAKYLYALETGEVSLLFLFSGSVFYQGADHHLQIRPIGWDKECLYRMPIRTWQELMETHYPDTVWFGLQQEVFDRLYAFKRRCGLATWDQAITNLLLSEQLDFKDEKRSGQRSLDKQPAERVVA
jgi:hypothetical protein